MQFLCIIIANCLPIICQSVSSFYYIAHIVAIATNYSNLLYQCFTNHYQSDPELYITSLPMITNNLPIITLVISSPLVANVLSIINLPMSLENSAIAANGLPLVPIGNDIWVREDHQIQQFLRWLLLKITSGRKKSPGYLFWLQKFKNDIKIALKPTGIML